LERLDNSDARKVFQLMNTGKSLKQLTDEQVQHLVKTFIATVTVISGCTVDNRMMLPTLKVVKKFLLTYYPYLTLAELNEAFEMNAAGMFDEIVSHYNRSLNCEFIGRVLAYYRDYRREQMAHIIAVRDALPPPAELQQQIPQQCAPPTEDDLKSIVETAYTWFKAGRPIIGAAFIYDYMVKFEIIPPLVFEDYTERAKGKLRGQWDNELQRLVNDRIRDGKYNLTFGAAHTGEAMDLQRKLDKLKAGKIDEEIQLSIYSEAKNIALNIEFKKFVDCGRQTIFVAA
jgi:hypothetical protein